MVRRRALQRPELADAGHLAELAGALEVPAVVVDDVVLHPGVDPRPRRGRCRVALCGQADVLDGRLADRLDVVVPAPAVEVVQAPLPFDQQVGRDQAAQSRRGHRRSQACWMSMNSSFGRGSRRGRGRTSGSSSAASAAASSTRRSRLEVRCAPPARWAARSAAAACIGGQHRVKNKYARRQRDQHQRAEAVAEQGDVDQQVDQDVEGEAAAVTAAAASAAAAPLKPADPPPAAASGGGAATAAVVACRAPPSSRDGRRRVGVSCRGRLP